MDLRVEGQIITHLKGESPTITDRDLAIDFTAHGTMFCRQQLAGHYYLSRDADTHRVFTFSPGLHEYDHAKFRQFVADLKLRRECWFNFETTGRFTGFMYRNGSLSFLSSHVGNSMTVYLKCTDLVAKDLESLSQTIERYMELCKTDVDIVEQMFRRYETNGV